MLEELFAVVGGDGEEGLLGRHALADGAQEGGQLGVAVGEAAGVEAAQPADVGRRQRALAGAHRQQRLGAAADRRAAAAGEAGAEGGRRVVRVVRVDRVQVEEGRRRRRPRAQPGERRGVDAGGVVVEADGAAAAALHQRLLRHVLEAAVHAEGAADEDVAREQAGAVAGGTEALGEGRAVLGSERQVAAGECRAAGKERLGRGQGVRRDAAVQAVAAAGEGQPVERRRELGRSAQVADTVGAQGVEDVDDDQARRGEAGRVDGRNGRRFRWRLGGRRGRALQPQVAPAARGAAPFGAQAHAHEAGLRPERQANGARGPEEIEPGGCPGEARDLPALALQDQLEALTGARRPGRAEGAGQGLAAGDRADEVDQGVAALQEVRAVDAHAAGGERRADGGSGDSRRRGAVGHLPGEVERDAPERQVGRQRYLERIGEREAAEVAGAVAEAQEAPSRRRGEIDGQPPRSRRELHQLQPGAGGGGDQPERAVRDLRRPAGQKAVAVAGGRANEAPLLDQQVGSVGLVEEGPQNRLGPAAPGRREGDERQSGQRDRSTEGPTAHDCPCYEHRAHPSRARRLRSAPRPDDRMPQGTVGGIEMTIANGCCPVVPTDCTTIRHWPTAGAFTTTCSTVLRLSE